MKKRKSVGLEVLEVQKPDGTIESTLKWRCSVCGREWYSKGEMIKKSFFSQSQVYSPPTCPHYFIEAGSGMKKVVKK